MLKNSDFQRDIRPTSEAIDTSILGNEPKNGELKSSLAIVSAVSLSVTPECSGLPCY